MNCELNKGFSIYNKIRLRLLNIIIHIFIIKFFVCESMTLKYYKINFKERCIIKNNKIEWILLYQP
jgi:hypothetical protein